MRRYWATVRAWARATERTVTRARVLYRLAGGRPPAAFRPGGRRALRARADRIVEFARAAGRPKLQERVLFGRADYQRGTSGEFAFAPSPRVQTLAEGRWLLLLDRQGRETGLVRLQVQVLRDGMPQWTRWLEATAAMESLWDDLFQRLRQYADRLTRRTQDESPWSYVLLQIIAYV